MWSGISFLLLQMLYLIKYINNQSIVIRDRMSLNLVFVVLEQMDVDDGSQSKQYLIYIIEEFMLSFIYYILQLSRSVLMNDSLIKPLMPLLLFYLITLASPTQINLHSNSFNNFQGHQQDYSQLQKVSSQTQQDFAQKYDSNYYNTAEDMRKNTVFGQSNQIRGKHNILEGNQNRVVGRNNVIEGFSNYAVGENNQMVGNHNYIESGRQNLILGIQNLLKGSRNSVIGKINYVSGVDNRISGENNNIQGNRSLIIGKRNSVIGNRDYVQGNNNLVQGMENHVVSDDSRVYGIKNTVVGDQNLVIGSNNKVYSSNNAQNIGKNPQVPAYPQAKQFSSQNVVKGVNNDIDGGRNNILGQNNLVKGHQNSLQGGRNYVIGSGNTVVNSNDKELLDQMNTRFRGLEQQMRQRQRAMIQSKLTQLTADGGVGSVYWPGGGMSANSNSRQSQARKTFVPPMRTNMKAT